MSDKVRRTFVVGVLENCGRSLHDAFSFRWVIREIVGELRHSRFWDSWKFPSFHRCTHNGGKCILRYTLWMVMISLRPSTSQDIPEEAHSIFGLNVLPLDDIGEHVFVSLNENSWVRLSMNQLLIPIPLNPFHEGVDLELLMLSQFFLFFVNFDVYRLLMRLNFLDF